MMRLREKITVGLALAIFPGIATAQESADERLQAAIVTAVAQALGADSQNLPDYDAELKAARLTADIGAVCGPQRNPQFLSSEVSTKVVAHAVDLLKKANISVSERPRYIRDLIVTSAISFESGRLAGSSPEYRAGLCAARNRAPAAQAITK